MTREEAREAANEYCRRLYSERLRDQALKDRPKFYGIDVVDAFVAGAGIVGAVTPIDMVLPCPRCGLLHIDAPEPEPECTCHVPEYEGAGQHAVTCAVFREVWTNPPHRSHLCHGCGLIWRPADVPTNGVVAVKTRGEKDSPWAKP